MRAHLPWLWLLFPSVAIPAELPSVDSPVKTGARAVGDAAVVVGIEDYGFLPDATYAARDADAFYAFLVYTRGIPSSRVNRLPANTAASEAGFDETGILVKEIQGLAGQGGGEVMVVTDACFTGAGRDGGALLASGRSWVPPTASAAGRAAQWDAVVEN